MLIGGHIANADNAAIRLRARFTNVEDFGFYFEDVARAHRLRPAKFVDAKTNRAPGQFKLAGNEQIHAHRAGVPAAGGKPLENAFRGGVLIEVKRLRIEFARERFDILRGDRDRARAKPIANMKVFEIEFRDRDEAEMPEGRIELPTKGL